MAIPDFSRLSRLSAPAFKLKVDKVFASESLNDRLISLSVILNNGEQSDQLSLVFDDRPGLFGGGIEVPKQDVPISVFLGYELNLVEMGEFVVNRVGMNGSSGGRTLSIAATPSLLNRDVTCTWANKTLGDIVDSIATAHNLKAKVSPQLKQEKLQVVNQVNESDSAFLTRLATRYNAVCKAMSGNLLFMLKGEGTSATGKPMARVNILAQDIIQWDKSISQQQDYKKICATWYDYINAQEQEVYFPEGTPKPDENVLRLPHGFNNKSEAKFAAQAKSEEVNREDECLSLTVIGNPDITAEGKIAINNIRGGVDGEYIVKSVTHTFSSGGYTSHIQAYVEPGT